MIPFILNCRKQKPFYSDRKQISGCQGMGARERQPGGMTRGGGAWGNLGEQRIYPRSWLWWRFRGWMHKSKRIKLYNLNKCSLLYVNYASIKLYFLKRCVFHCMKIVLQDFFFNAGIHHHSLLPQKRKRKKKFTQQIWVLGIPRILSSLGSSKRNPTLSPRRCDRSVATTPQQRQEGKSTCLSPDLPSWDVALAPACIVSWGARYNKTIIPGVSHV